MRIAFYAPMKAPTHEIPSGDRRVARLFMEALTLAGHEVYLASDLRCYDKTGTSTIQEQQRDQAAGEVVRILNEINADPSSPKPDLWFTYHVYHKAPDWIGPLISKALHIPYAVAEASHAPKQAGGPWALGYEAAAQAIRSAAKVFYMTDLDGNCLRDLVSDDGKLVKLPPFMKPIESSKSEISPDVQALIRDRELSNSKDIRLLTVAMMRPGDKMNSYTQLAEMLSYLPPDGWTLMVVGDGECEAEVKALFEPFAGRVSYFGQRGGADLEALYAEADLYVWPACGEAYGMALLEAEWFGTPVIAGDVRGVPDVVQHGHTGYLIPEGDMKAMAGQIITLQKDPARLQQLSEQAALFVRRERSLEATSDLLNTHLEELFK
ncbi:glycosyltransferase family 4 protein [Sneathiella limimaris]|uniref:glycosyltransferase family 4 protein n=1 Tax=Sneathiella limimaris TaxID=1964213 RepID=UPI00146D9D76|nr:glycosyltransferase family 4 protein [Sneathiella limimaris]